MRRWGTGIGNGWAQAWALVIEVARPGMETAEEAQAVCAAARRRQLVGTGVGTCHRSGEAGDGDGRRGTGGTARRRVRTPLEEGEEF